MQTITTIGLDIAKSVFQVHALFELAADLGCVRQIQEELRSRRRAGSSYLWCSRRLPDPAVGFRYQR